jgi:hypothetical protein
MVMFHGAFQWLLSQQTTMARMGAGMHTSVNGREMGLPLGLPTGACWAAASPATSATMEIWANMVIEMVGIMGLSRRRK